MAYYSIPSGINYSYPSHIPGLSLQPCADRNACRLRVEGTGSVKAQPDIAEVILGIVTENQQLKTAQEENAAGMNAVIRVLRESGIPMEDIQTQSYNISPQYDFIEGKQVFRGYRVDHLLNITVRDLSKVGAIIDAAVQSGANVVNSIRFSVEDLSGYYQQALKAAVDDALVKARTLGIKLNLEVFPVPVHIVEKGFDLDTPEPLLFQAATDATPVQPGMIEVSARIETVFNYRPVKHYYKPVRYQSGPMR